MLHRLLRLGFDVKITLKAYASAVSYRHFHKAGNVFLLEFNVGVQKRFVALASAPENVALSAELNGYIKRLFNLRRGKRKNVRAVGRARAVHVAGVAEHIRRSPKALYVRALHFFKYVV